MRCRYIWCALLSYPPKASRVRKFWPSEKWTTVWICYTYGSCVQMRKLVAQKKYRPPTLPASSGSCQPLLHFSLSLATRDLTLAGIVSFLSLEIMSKYCWSMSTWTLECIFWKKFSSKMNSVGIYFPIGTGKIRLCESPTPIIFLIKLDCLPY